MKQLVIGVNKMDTDTAGPYGQARFDEVGTEMRDMLVKTGWKPDFVKASVPVIPISGWEGDNLLKESTNMGWYKGQELTNASGTKMKVGSFFFKTPSKIQY